MRKIIGLSVCALLSVACSESVFDPGKDDAGGNINVGGGGDGGTSPEASAPPPGCDATKLPTDAPCVIDDFAGVFASSSLGTAAGDGTQAHPLASLDAAIALAKKSNKRVYACAETYAEQIHIEDGVSVFGYFSCSATAWAVSANHAKVLAPASPAAIATNVTSPTRFEAVDLVAPNFTTGSQSSIGLFANGSPGLHIVGATIHAGAGGKGADGVNGVQLTDSGNAKNGANAWADGVCTNGTNCFTVSLLKSGQAAGGTNACVGEAGHDGGPGGQGGHPGQFQLQSFNGNIWNAVDQGTTSGFPIAPTAQTAQGGSIGIGGGSGAPGANGNDGLGGTDFGTLTANGYASADGTNGTSGAPGQGGGGSGGYNALNADYPPYNYTNGYAWGEPGAGGGAGGCPGLAAQAGRGGGASFGIVALSSGFTLDNVTVESSKGGDGGKAGAQSTPTAGGLGGKPPLYGHTNGGGNGGAGGHAGASGNGGGGPSIGIVYDKTAPTQSASKVTHGAGGAGVSQFPASLDGRSVDVYQFGQ